MTAEQKAALKRAFNTPGTDFIYIDGWANEWLKDAYNAAIDAGYIKSTCETGDQYTALIGRLTAKGRKEILA